VVSQLADPRILRHIVLENRHAQGHTKEKDLDRHPGRLKAGFGKSSY
jgi:hypothetical protein